ncbi:MAG: tRNA (adenosine(37)-N6)-threonylcarbamoyltransferase complex ATPase subunit type 1 TsaE [Candidatus Pacebacteria bacterium]|nr:tRNA (adenosine(37)-N6)-threonylcarbamoyltransferase complex ATPase subunit type 1 TsaE [Candidatus Paceibacterota bacterium]
MSIKIFTTFSAKETKDLAEKILVNLIKKSPKDKALVLVLQGNLGSGKTTFTQGLAKYLGIKQRITSPTFVMMKRFKIYDLRFKNFYHFDCYRLNKPEEILNLGWQETIVNPKNIVAIEWPEKIKKFLPKETVYLKFKFINENQRVIHLV